MEKSVRDISARADRHRTRLDHRAEEISQLQEEAYNHREILVELQAQVASLSDKICHCGDQSPESQGSRDAPIVVDEDSEDGLEYFDPPMAEDGPAGDATTTPVRRAAWRMTAG